MRIWEAVIFDWAGTTVDEVRKPMGMLKRDHIKTMLEMPRIRRLWEEKYGSAPEEKDVDLLYGIFEEKLMGILDRFAEVKPHVMETVAELRKRGIRIGSTTGYTDEMMEIVVPKAKENGYAPDCWFSPNSVGNMGRPYPYMIFKNMETLGLSAEEYDSLSEEERIRLREEAAKIFLEAGAGAVIRDMSELPELLEQSV